MAAEAVNATGNSGAAFFGAYSSFISLFPVFLQQFISLFVIVLLIVLYSVFVWKFYRSVSTKDIIKLDLAKYNRMKHPVYERFLAAVFYFLEYLFLMPVMIFIWFSVFTLLLIFLTENLEVSTLLLISATIIASIRMVSYYRQDLASDVAKLIPFTFLAVSILNPGFFSVERFFDQFSQIPNFLDQILVYFVFITLLEIILRFFSFVFSEMGVGDTGENDEEDK